ncbi:MAG TPA: S9 family peptidase [Candidatus Coprenecus stercoravium]|uniref:S9 family peptidase n=1 Tax=Candidatus Coprenecus stercoravium TaxID=2840735 RepID=A0A9D2KAD2_9BACT|nr:S9 family peptidase [Candidatus Coprenecus stercoravium]
MKRFWIFLLSSTAVICCATSLNTYAQGKLTLEDIYSNGTYKARTVKAFSWAGDGHSFLTLEQDTVTGGQDIVLNDIRTGEKTVAVPASALIPDGGEKPLEIDGYTWSPDRSMLMVYTDAVKVWRTEKRGDYWLYVPATGELRKLGRPDFEKSWMQFAKFSPDGSRIAYVYKNNLYVEDTAGGEVRQLTSDGDEVIINGQFDWVYEEELHVQDGWRWSPDSRSIAYWQFDTEGTGTFYMVDNIDSIYSSIIPLPYPKAGTTNSAARIGVVDVDSAGPETRWLDIPGDPREHYLARMEFVPGTCTLMIQQLNRQQSVNKVFYADIHTMSIDNFMTDTDEAWLDVFDNTVWLDGGKYFTWTSEQDGWRHLYRISRDGSRSTLITNGDFDMESVVRIDAKGGWVYYIASPDNATERYLYRSRLDGKGTPRRLTPEDAPAGHHGYIISPDAKYAMHTFSNSETPTVYEIITLPDHKTVRILEDNHELAWKFAAADPAPMEFFKVDIGDIILDGWMIRPPHFDSTAKYPVIFYIYGEPAGSTVQNAWLGGELWGRYLAQEGYVVMSIDVRGAKTPRGRQWRKSIHGKIGILPIADHAAAVTKLLQTYSFMDPDRIGIWGWSGGGSSTAHLMFKHPEIYSTGIAVAGVYSLYLYDTIYQERYSGIPSLSPQSYHDGSAINFASGLEGDLLLIHGTGDDNVHYQCCEMMVNELIRQGKMFYMIPYPMRSHSINERENTSYHLYKSMFRFWQENL